LGALRLYADLIAMPGVLREEYQRYADELYLLSERSKELVGQLMQQAESDRPRDTAKRLVLPHVIEQCHGLLCRVAGYAVETEFGPGSRWPVMASAGSVERILTNLVKNAGEAVARKGSDEWEKDRKIRVTVEAAVEGPSPRLVLTVADSGCGMSGEELRALEEGMRLTHSGAGRGLGLRVVRELAALSGAGVRIESRSSVGTSVMVEWEGIAQRESERRIRLMEAEAGWIAC
jgi:signal transduction histidine kinase